MIALKILSAALIIAGALVNYAAKFIVKRYGIKERVKVPEAYEFSGEELENYKQLKALSIVKAVGFGILFPGVILVFFAW